WAPQMLFFSQNLGPKVIGGHGMISIAPGWELPKEESAILFWIKNLGAFIPLAALGAWKTPQRDIKIMALAGLILFLLGNFVMFTPWSWDNIKVLEFGFLLALPAAVAALLWMGVKQPAVFTPIVLVLVLSMTLAGILDLTRVLRFNSEKHRIFTEYEVRVAEWLRDNTPKDAIVLAAPIFNQPVMLSGRRVVLGYPGHVWSHGLPLEKREQDVKAMSRGAPSAPELLHQYHVTYAVYGSREREYGFNQEYFDRGGLFETLWTASSGNASDQITVYRLRETATAAP